MKRATAVLWIAVFLPSSWSVRAALADPAGKEKEMSNASIESNAPGDHFTSPERQASATPDPRASRLAAREGIIFQDARQAVRMGNERLIQGHPRQALEAYRHAEELEPDAREIAFVKGLAHYDLKEFDAAREAFRKAAASGDDKLADDALYSLGATDHAEALEVMESNPRLAVSLLESAMRRYHDVLGKRPDHKAARDANFKAASIWRELKRRLEQQQPSRDGEEAGQKDQREEDNDRQKDQQPQENESDREQDSSQNQPQAQERQQQEEQRSDAAQQRQDEQQRRESQAKDQEQVSREQAERRLREMTQAVRERKKMRRRRPIKLPIAPVDKDW